MQGFEGAAAQGLTNLMGIAPVITVLVLVLMAMGFLLWKLLVWSREDSQKSRDALNNNTAILSALKETIDHAVRK